MTVSRYSLTALTLLASALPASAGAPQVTVQADRTSAQFGQPILVTVRVRGAADTPEVRPPQIEGAALVPLGPPRVVPTFAADLEAKGIIHAGTGGRFAGALKGLGDPAALGGLDPDLMKMLGAPDLLKAAPGRDTNDYTFVYRVDPQKPGQYVVPAFTVASGGQTATTKPIALDVTPAKPQPWVRMALSLSNPTPTVGEEVQLYVDLLVQRTQVSFNNKTYPHLPVKEMSLTIPGLDGVAQFELVKSLETVVQEGAVEPGHRGFRVNGLPGEVKLEHEPADRNVPGLDPARYRRRLTIPLRMREGGQVTIPPARVAGDVYVPSSARAGKWEPFVAAGAPLTFAVVDLRGRADRPADFGGLIGPVRVTAQASQTRLAVGTPFTLKVRLEGSGSLAQATAPDLAARPDFAKSFRVRHEDERLAGAAREFTYTLRPLSADVKEVPPVQVSYYDPKSSQFAAARSPAIPLEVTTAANVTPDAPPDVPVPAPAPTPAPPAQASAPAPEEEAPELPVAEAGSDRLLAWAEVGLAAVCAVIATVWGVRAWKRRRLTRASRRRYQATMAEATRGLQSSAPTIEGVRQTMQDFLRRRFRLPPGEVTPRDAADCLRGAGVEEGLARACADLLETCATAEFAPGVVALSPTDLAAYARKLIDRLASAPALAGALGAGATPPS